MKQQLIALALSTALLAGSAAAIAPEEAFPAVNTYPGGLHRDRNRAGTARIPALHRREQRRVVL